MTGGGRTNTWDSQNRLVSCVYNGTTSTFTYGADGLRRSSTVSGVTTYYVYDGQTLIREMMKNAQGAFYNTATYLQGPRGTECRIDDTQQTEGYYNPADASPRPVHSRGVTKWYVYDGLGSVVGEMDPNGNLTSSPKYDVYGLVRSNSGTASSKMGFVGGLGHMSEANTGLIYMRARYYDPQQGRFESQDTKQDQKPYAYCDDNPVNSIDENGHDPLNLVRWAAGIAAIVCVVAALFLCPEITIPYLMLAGAVGGGLGALIGGLIIGQSGVALLGDVFAGVLGGAVIGLTIGLIQANLGGGDDGGDGGFIPDPPDPTVWPPPPTGC